MLNSLLVSVQGRVFSRSDDKMANISPAVYTFITQNLSNYRFPILQNMIEDKLKERKM